MLAMTGVISPWPICARVAGFRTLFLAVSIMRGGMGIPNNLSLLQYYSDKGGSWKLVSEESGLYDGSVFSLATLEPTFRTRQGTSVGGW